MNEQSLKYYCLGKIYSCRHERSSGFFAILEQMTDLPLLLKHFLVKIYFGKRFEYECINWYN